MILASGTGKDRECAEKKTARFIQGSKAKEGEMSEEQRKTYLGNVRGLVGDVLEVSRLSAP